MFQLYRNALSRKYHSVSRVSSCLRRGVHGSLSGRLDNPNYVHFSQNDIGFDELGLMQPLVEALQAQGLHTPTEVQSSVIPRLISTETTKGENLVLSAGTGSGKTLAYTLPAIHNLLTEEERGYRRLHRHPRCLVLVPTRELASQVLEEVKRLGHFAKIASCSILGGESYNIQTEALKKKVDMVVAAPGRLVQHEKLSNIKLSEVNHVVIDEVDTMLMQGFGADIRYILRKVFEAKYRSQVTSPNGNLSMQPTIIQPQLVMASATMTKAVRALVQDIDGFSTNFDDSSAREGRINDGANLKSASKVRMSIAEISGVHRSIPNVKHNMIDIKGRDKLNVLQDVIEETENKVRKTMIFCNTIDSCRAVAYFMEVQFTNRLCLSYHGEIKSSTRVRNMDIFRDDNSLTPMFMVCTDIAARGLDIQGVDHVIMFDFPLNPVDYLHRSGRTGRLGQTTNSSGLVTAIVAKRDRVLAHAIDGAIIRNKPLDNLSSNKKDYQDKGKLAAFVGRRDRESLESSRQKARINSRRTLLKGSSNKRLVSDPNRAGIYVKQTTRKTVSRTVAKRIAEINQKRGEALVRKRQKATAKKKKK